MAQTSKNQNTTQTSTSVFFETQSEQLFDSSADCFEQFLNDLLEKMEKETAEFLQKVDQHISNSFEQLNKTLKQETNKPVKPITTKGNNPFDNYWKFKVKPNGKEPMCKWRDPVNQQKPAFNPSRFNTGVPTGTRNNLLVVDLDVKDDGVEEFKNYISEHGRPETLTVKTTTGGYHYYFNYSTRTPTASKWSKPSSETQPNLEARELISEARVAT